MKTKIFAIIFLLAANALISFAQGLNVRGTVRDTHGDPVTGAVVMLQGSTTVATVTNAKGTWALSLPAGSKDAVLVFSCISFADRVEQVAGRGVIDVVLEDDTETLEEVVVVGYGAMRRSDLTGSVASVRIDDDNAAKSSTLDQMLDGRAAGIQVLSDSGSPDAGVTIRVRGIASFTGNTDPLYVVDGVIVGGSSNGLATMQVGTSNNAQEETNGLAGINPQDIASIEILKDASATAIYGSRGANGVVLITTKQATKDIPVVRFNSGVSVSETDKRLDILGFDEYVQMLKAYGTSTSEGQLAKLYEDPSTLSGLKVTPIDWQDYIFRTAVSHRYYFSVSGRPKGYNYLFSVGYNHNEGVIRASDSDNLTARLNLEKRVFRRLKLSFKTSVGYVKSNLVTGAVNGGNITSRSSLIRSALRSKPYITINPEEDTEEYDSSATDDINFGPSRWLNGMTNTSERMRVNPSLSADLTLAKWLTFRSTLGADFVKNERIKTKVSRLSVGYGNTAGVGDAKSFRWNWDNLLIADFKRTVIVCRPHWDSLRQGNPMKHSRLLVASCPSPMPTSTILTMLPPTTASLTLTP